MTLPIRNITSSLNALEEWDALGVHGGNYRLRERPDPTTGRSQETPTDPSIIVKRLRMRGKTFTETPQLEQQQLQLQD